MAINEVVVKLAPGTSAREAIDDIKIILWSLGFEAVERDGRVVISATDMTKLQTPTVVLDFGSIDT